MTKEVIYRYVGFTKVPTGIEAFFEKNDFKIWKPRLGADRDARAKWQYTHWETAGKVDGVYQQAPNIQEELLPQDMGLFVAIIKLEAELYLFPGVKDDRKILTEKIEKTVDALMSKYASLGATRYTHEDALRRSSA